MNIVISLIIVESATLDLIGGTMTVFAMVYRFLILIPQNLRDSKMGHVIILMTILFLEIEAANTQYTIITQRIELGFPSITPTELDSLEGLCILNINPIRGLLYNKELICTPAVKGFFYERLDKKDPR